MQTDEQGLKTVAAVVYALLAAGFFVGITWIIAVIIDYVKKDDAKGTWLESHYRWQLRTFWFGLLWGVIGGVLSHRQGLAQARGAARGVLTKRCASA
jgi:uncharacterized membrane protein